MLNAERQKVSSLSITLEPYVSRQLKLTTERVVIGRVAPIHIVIDKGASCRAESLATEQNPIHMQVLVLTVPAQTEGPQHQLQCITCCAVPSPKSMVSLYQVPISTLVRTAPCILQVPC